MEIIFITVPVTLVFIAVGVGIFFWASKGGQFDDLDGPAHRILFDDDEAPKQQDKTTTDGSSPTDTTSPTDDAQANSQTSDTPSKK